MSLVFVLQTLFIILVEGRKGFGPTEQEWGFVTVRENAHMFWWLHKTSAPVQNYTDRPLIIWLQGGPGSSSTGYGNFAELGPLDPDLNNRNTTWIQYANVLFVDNPVGTGYSYVETLDALASTNKQIADDFIVLLQEFYEVLPELKPVPMYIFSESYGGKMAVEIALAIDKAFKAGVLEASLVGIGLGDPWISPIDLVMSYSNFLLNLGFVDQNGYEQIQTSAEATRIAFENENFSEATTLWSTTEQLIKLLTFNVDFYNVMTKIQQSQRRENDQSKINHLMNGVVKDALQLDRSWGFQSGFVFFALAEDFMKPVTNIVENLLNTTDCKIAVYNGQLDLIVATPGTKQWVDNLKFKDSDMWKTTERKAIIVNDIVEGFYKKLNNFSFYVINRTGHMVPIDNPEAMHYILKDLTNNFETLKYKQEYLQELD